MRWTALIALSLAATGMARADTDPSSVAIASRPAESPPHNLVYVELLGKGGPYGVGFERSITPRVALGVVASYAVVRDRQLATAAPYLHATVVRSRHHALFGEIGAMLVHSRIPSPVPEWDGSSDTGLGGIAAAGWELSGRRLVLRSYAGAVVGEGGFGLCMGVALGVRP